MKIKWINDVHFKNKKVSGCLCECSSQGKLNFIHVGIGVNLNSSPIPCLSTCLSQILGGKTVDVDHFVERLSHYIVRGFSEAGKSGLTGPVKEKVERRLEYLNEEVVILD